MRILIGILLVTILSHSCDPESSLGKNYADLSVVTGLDLFDESGNAVGRFRNPNKFLTEGQVFPIPSTGIINIFHPNDIAGIWVIPADCIKKNSNDVYAEISQDLEYSDEELDNSQLQNSVFENETIQLSLNLEPLGSGFYRVFMRLRNGDLRWENVYIDTEVTNFPDPNFLEELCL